MPKLSALTAKAAPTTADELIITDKADSNNTKRITANNLPLSAAAVSGLAAKAALAGADFTGDVTTTGNLGVGTSSPRKRADLGDGDMIIGDTGVASKYWLGRPLDGAGAAYIGHESTSDNDLSISVSSGGANIKFYSALAERMRLDASGNLGVGTTPSSWGSDFSALEIGNAATLYGSKISEAVQLASNSYADGSNSRAKVTERGAALILNNGGFFFQNAPSVSAGEVQTFSETMRLDSSGNLLVGKTVNLITTPGASIASDGRISTRRDNGEPLALNRTSSDGSLVSFLQDNVAEGSISVSGTTVSYNGGHLARWSRMLDGSKPENLLKGTVMTNLDEMIEWAYDETPEVLWAAGDGLPEGVSVGDVKVEGVDPVEETYWEEGDELPEGVSVGDVKTEAVEAVAPVVWEETDGLPEGVSIGDVKVEYKPAGVEDNEQLNHTAISSVEGDKDVAGVFIAWDDDDEYNDYNLAMVGDVIIRIAEGVEVKRGDLLVSAGDGTAKPQDPEAPLTVGLQAAIVAKVTSTVVSCTYDDGSFCIPCVLK